MYSSILSFQPFFFFFCFVACFHSFTPSTTFFFLCYRDLPVNQFNPNFLPSISTKTARNEFQLPLHCSFFGITEFSRSNTPLFFFLCYRDLPVNQFNPNFLPSISTKTARNEFQLPLNCSFFGIPEFSRSNTGFSNLTLKKYLIDPVMSWFIKRCKSCLSFSCCQSCRAFAP